MVGGGCSLRSSAMGLADSVISFSALPRAAQRERLSRWYDCDCGILLLPPALLSPPRSFLLSLLRRLGGVCPRVCVLVGSRLGHPPSRTRLRTLRSPVALLIRALLGCRVHFAWAFSAFSLASFSAIKSVFLISSWGWLTRVGTCESELTALCI